MLRIPAKLFGPQPLAAVTTVFAVGIIMPSMINTGGHLNGQASGTRSGSHAGAANGPVWAITVTGRKILVPKPKFAPTPVRPEKITHPKADTMGAVTAAHASWRHSPRLTNAIQLGHGNTAQRRNRAPIPPIYDCKIMTRSGCRSTMH